MIAPKDNDSLPTNIGTRVEKVVEEKKVEKKEVAPYIWQGPDGKLETRLPEKK